MEVEVTVSKDEGPATHILMASGRKFRKGQNGFGEVDCGNGEWLVSDWKNDELDTCNWFKPIEVNRDS